MRHLLFGLLFVFTTYSHLSAAVFFVDYEAGSDSNDGRATWSPWKHCPGDPAASAVPATRTLAPGDVVLFRGGVTYVLSASSGISVKANGSATAPIVYASGAKDGWGSGLARFTDQNGGSAITAFSAPALAQYLEFRSLEFYRIGGASVLPADTGSPASPRFGGGIAFPGGVDSVTVADCVFRELGYWSNQKPMAAASLNGIGVSAVQARNLKISQCRFSRVAFAIDLAAASTLSAVEISKSTFEDAVVWPLHLPVGPNAAAATAVSFVDCTTQPDITFAAGAWNGYGNVPATDVATITAGATATLYATAIASPSPSYQWRRNGLPIAGATGAQLRLASVSSSDAGVYTAIASNAGGSAASNAAVLTVNGSSSGATAPVIIAQPQSQSVPLDSSASLSIVVSGQPTPAIQWKRNGVDIPGATASTLVFARVTSADFGFYQAVATNVAGTVLSNTAKLTGSVSTSPATLPVFTVQPESRSTQLNAVVSFTAAATGSPAPMYQWQKDGSPIPGATAATFTLASVTGNDRASYRVIATNTAGSATSNSVTLTVLEAPVFTLQPVSQTAEVASSLTLSVVAAGNPAPVYQWRKDGASIAGANAPTLTLASFSSADAGTYSVVASNGAGSVTSNAAVVTIAGFSVPPPAGTSTGVKTVIHSMMTLTGAPHRASFTIEGTVPRRMLVRAVGPSLSAFGATDLLVNPVLELSQGERVILINDNWKGSSILSNAFAQAGTFPFISAGSADSAFLLTLDPGTYGLKVYGNPSSLGLMLLEVYEMP